MSALCEKRTHAAQQKPLDHHVGAVPSRCSMAEMTSTTSRLLIS
jgi:hypothetical protein